MEGKLQSSGLCLACVLYCERHFSSDITLFSWRLAFPFDESHWGLRFFLWNRSWLTRWESNGKRKLKTLPRRTTHYASAINSDHGIKKRETVTWPKKVTWTPLPSEWSRRDSVANLLLWEHWHLLLSLAWEGWNNAGSPNASICDPLWRECTHKLAVDSGGAGVRMRGPAPETCGGDTGVIKCAVPSSDHPGVADELHRPIQPQQPSLIVPSESTLV